MFGSFLPTFNKDMMMIDDDDDDDDDDGKIRNNV